MSKGSWGFRLWEGMGGRDCKERSGAGIQALSFSLLVYKNVYLMPHKRPCAHLWLLLPTYAPFPTVEPMERGDVLIVIQTTGHAKCCGWVGAGGR